MLASIIAADYSFIQSGIADHLTEVVVFDSTRACVTFIVVPAKGTGEWMTLPEK